MVRVPRIGRVQEAGLATLEWLLVVAAVAGLVALAVVLVQRVVDDTAGEVSASTPRLAAAAVAALEVERNARAATSAAPRTATWSDWAEHFTAKCARLMILYEDVALEVDAAFAAPTADSGTDPISGAALAAATEAASSPSRPQVKCNIVTPGVVAAADAPPPLRTIDDFRADARAIADAAARLRPGDTWATWKAHFEPLCSDLASTYAHLGINAVSAFNWPVDQLDPSAAVTQDLLDAASTAPPANGRPQIRCEVDQ